jgi:hypothetical protein
MPLKVREDVTHEKWLARALHSREAASIVSRNEQRDSGCEQIVEDSLHRIVDGLDVSYSSVTVDLQIRNVTRHCRSVRTPGDRFWLSRFAGKLPA